MILLLNERLLGVGDVELGRLELFGVLRQIVLARGAGHGLLRVVLHLSDLHVVVIFHFLVLDIVQGFEITSNITDGFL